MTTELDNGTATIGTGRIVVGVDGSEPSLRALQWAERQARLTGSEVHAVIAWHLPTQWGYPPVPLGDIDWAGAAAATLEKAIADAFGDIDQPHVHQHVMEGHPGSVLLHAAADADLLVVGRRGHGGFVGLLVGSVSQYLVTHAPCAVLVA